MFWNKPRHKNHPLGVKKDQTISIDQYVQTEGRLTLALDYIQFHYSIFNSEFSNSKCSNSEYTNSEFLNS